MHFSSYQPLIWRNVSGFRTTPTVVALLIVIFNIALSLLHGTINLMRSFRLDKNFFDFVIHPKIQSLVYKSLMLDPNLIPIISLITVIKLSCQLCLDLPNLPFHSQFSTAFVCALLLAARNLRACLISSLWFDLPDSVCWRAQIIEFAFFSPFNALLFILLFWRPAPPLSFPND